MLLNLELFKLTVILIYIIQECKESVEKSMNLFFKKEELKNNNKYRCSKCKKLVEAVKGYVIRNHFILLIFLFYLYSILSISLSY